MRRFLPALLAAVFVGCPAPDPLGIDAVPFDPPAWYRTVWAETATCAGAYRAFEAVTWWITPGPVPTGDGRGAAGAHLDGRIYLRADLVEHDRLVSHEILHALIGDPDHRRDRLWTLCVRPGATVTITRGGF